MSSTEGEMQRYLLFWRRDKRLPPPFVAGIARRMLPLLSPKAIFKLLGVAPYVERSVEPFVVHQWQPLSLAILPKPPSVLADEAWRTPKDEDHKLHHIAVVAGGVAFKNGAILDKAGSYVWGASHKHYADIRAARAEAGIHCTPHRWRPKIQRVSGQVIAATTSNSSFYYHWLVDVLVRILRARSLGYDQAKIYVEAARPFQRQSLELAGIPAELIVNADEYPVIEADQLVVPCHHIFPGAEFPQWLVELIRTTFQVDATASVERRKRIYISRADAKTRGIINEADVEELVDEYGFETVRLADLPFVEQIRLFSSAEAVAGAHGGGLTNFIFCHPETKVLELFPAFNKNDCYWRLASAMRLQYSYLKNPQEADRRGSAEFPVNLDHLRMALENMFSRTDASPTLPDAPCNTNKAPCI